MWCTLCVLCHSMAVCALKGLCKARWLAHIAASLCISSSFSVFVFHHFLSYSRPLPPHATSSEYAGCCTWLCLCSGGGGGGGRSQKIPNPSLSFQLRTVTGNEFLLQSETDSVIMEWFNTLRGVIDRLVSRQLILTLGRVLVCVH